MTAVCFVLFNLLFLIIQWVRMCLLAFSADWFSDGIFRKKGLEFSKPFVLRMDY